MKKIFLFTFIFNISTVFAQYKFPCVNNKSQLDLSCSCKKSKSCYKPLKKVDKKIYKLGTQTKMDKKLTKVVMRAYKAEEQLFSGKIKPTNKQFKALDKLNGKLGKIRKKKVKQYEKYLKRKGAKMWKMKDRMAYANKKLLKEIPKSKRDKLLKSGFQSSFAKFFADKSGMKGYVPMKSDPKSGVLIAQDKKSIDDSNDEPTTAKTTDNKEYTVDTKGIARTRSKNFKYDTITKKPEVSIFKVISNRYGLVSDRLDQKAISKSVHGADKKELIKSLSNFLNKG